MAIRVAHPVDGGDASTIFGFTEELIGTLLDVQGVGLRSRRDPFSRIHRLANATAFLLQQDLLNSSAHQAIEPRVEELVEHLIGQIALDDSCRCGSDIQIVRKTQEYLAANYTRRATLGEIGAAVGRSQFCLSRSFCEATGSGIHEYVTRLRLRDAVS